MDNYNNIQICVIELSTLVSPCPRLGQLLLFVKFVCYSKF